jgi:hypothetical protein
MHLPLHNKAAKYHSNRKYNQTYNIANTGVRMTTSCLKTRRFGWVQPLFALL